MKSLFFVLSFCLQSFLSQVSCQPSDAVAGKKIIAHGAVPKLISKQFSFTEGPAVDKKGDVYFTDQPNNKIWRYSTDGRLSVFLSGTRRSNGLYFDKKGNLVSCADELNQLISISPEGKMTTLVNDIEGHKLNGPNDLWIHHTGGIYFTDPYYKRDWWTRTDPQVQGEKVYFLASNKKKAIAVDSSLKKPNGIIGTPDGKYLYVADTGGNQTFKFFINKDGTLSHRQLFAEQGSDGMTIDTEGNIYLTGKGVTVYNKDGKKIEHIDIPENWTANVCFGGKNLNELFITASQAVYILDMAVKGVR